MIPANLDASTAARVAALTPEARKRDLASIRREIRSLTGKYNRRLARDIEYPPLPAQRWVLPHLMEQLQRAYAFQSFYL